jgi:GNAT superfamily N-acetyltransferase
MDGETPHIEVRAVNVNDTPTLHELDYDFETDRIYALRVHNGLVQNKQNASNGNQSTFTFELVETQVDPPLYKNYREREQALTELDERVHNAQGGFVALADGKIAGAILLNIDEARSVVDIQDMIVGRQYRRYGVGSLLISCASDWARNHGCWAIVLETQNTNYPAIQFYFRNGLEIWSINRSFYPPGEYAHEVAIFMGKRLSSTVSE